MTFQDNLRIYRERAGYAQAKDFAAFLGIKYSTYIGYESQGKEPKYDALRRIAEALNVSIDTLLSFRPSEYGEYKRLATEAGYSIEEQGNGYITITYKFDKNLKGMRIAYVGIAMNELFHSPDSE